MSHVNKRFLNANALSRFCQGYCEYDSCHMNDSSIMIIRGKFYKNCSAMLNHNMGDDLYHPMEMAASDSSLIPPMNQFDYCAGKFRIKTGIIVQLIGLNRYNRQYSFVGVVNQAPNIGNLAGGRYRWSHINYVLYV